MKEKKAYFVFLIASCAALAFTLSGCIRLWGGATYVQSKPGDYREKTYVLDTAGLVNKNQAKGSIQ